jgi:methyl-accepting chemotaxis protein
MAYLSYSSAMKAMEVDISRHAELTTASVDESVSGAEEGKNQVDKTRDSIVVLVNKVEQAGSVISNLNKHAQDINGILATIQGIANQPFYWH